MEDSNITEAELGRLKYRSPGRRELRELKYRSPGRRELRDSCAGELVSPMEPSRRKLLHHTRTRNRKARARIYLAPFSYWFRP